jgi:cell wall-associated NlpC family hydrolase
VTWPPPIEWRDLAACPYAVGGEDVAIGLCCSGILREVYRRAGVLLPPFEIGEAAFRVLWQPVKRKDIQPLDTLWWTLDPRGRDHFSAIAGKPITHHAAVHVGGGSVLTAWRDGGAIVWAIDKFERIKIPFLPQAFDIARLTPEARERFACPPA